MPELRRLATAASGDAGSGRSGAALVVGAPATLAAEHAERQRVIRASMRAALAHDPEAVYRILQREAIRVSTVEFLDDVATPFMRRIGDEWAAGRATEAQERVASSALRRVLGILLQNLRIDERDRDASARAPRRVLATTLAGERHENGALMAAVIAALAGCDVSYPGVDLPPAAIAAAARKAHADIVALSLVDGTSPRIAQRELVELREALPARIRIVVGGASAALVGESLEALGTKRFESLAAWHRALDGGLSRGDRAS
jgi:methanogenic corrinoid protein MtbC1